jgi:hypothetical protein
MKIKQNIVRVNCTEALLNEAFDLSHAASTFLFLTYVALVKL